MELEQYAIAFARDKITDLETLSLMQEGELDRVITSSADRAKMKEALREMKEFQVPITTIVGVHHMLTPNAVLLFCNGNAAGGARDGEIPSTLRAPWDSARPPSLLEGQTVDKDGNLRRRRQEENHACCPQDKSPFP